MRRPFMQTAIPAGNAATASSSRRVSGTDGKAKSAGTSAGEDVSHGRASYAASVVDMAPSLARRLATGAGRRTRIDGDVVERKVSLRPGEHEEEEQRDDAGQQQHRAEQLEPAVTGQMTPDPHVHRSAHQRPGHDA